MPGCCLRKRQKQLFSADLRYFRKIAYKTAFLHFFLILVHNGGVLGIFFRNGAKSAPNLLFSQFFSILCKNAWKHGFSYVCKLVFSAWIYYRRKLRKTRKIHCFSLFSPYLSKCLGVVWEKRKNSTFEPIWGILAKSPVKLRFCTFFWFWCIMGVFWLSFS